MQKIWIATDLFYPDETSTSFILTKIANKLCEKYQVNVVHGENLSKLSNLGKNSLDINPNINLTKLKNFSDNKNNLLQRSIRFLYLSVALTYFLFKNVKKGEKVFTVTNPVPIILFISILKKFRSFHWALLVHDVFPENTIPAGIFKKKKSFTYRILKYFFDKAYTSADQLIVLGRDMEEVVRSKTGSSAKISIIENWSDTVNIYPKTNIEGENYNVPSKKIVFQFAGNIGRVQGLLELLDVFSRIKNDKICLQIIGDGVSRPQLEKFVADNQLKSVTFGDVYSRKEQNAILNSADIAVIILAKGMFGLGVPSKVYNILAAGKPILYIGEKNSEIYRMMTENDIGYFFQNEQIEELQEFFENFEKNSEELKIKGNNARKIAEEKYTEEIILNKFLTVI